MKKILGKVGIIFIIILLALITFTNAQENEVFNYIEEQEQEEQKLKEKETANIALEQNVGISTIANSDDYKVTQLDLKEWSTGDFTIDGDTTSVYFCNENEIKKYSVVTKKMETVVSFEKPQYYHCVQGNIFYMLVSGTTTAQTYHVKGYDLIQKKYVFDKKFNVNAEENVYKDFAVDSNQNFYFPTGKRIITSFDKNGKKLESATNPIDDQIIIKQLTPDGKTLIFETYMSSQRTYKSGYLAVENGKFLRYYGKEMPTSENIPFFLGSYFSNELKFNKECTFAFDSIGRIFKYTFEEQYGFRTTSLSYVEDANTSYIRFI